MKKLVILPFVAALLLTTQSCKRSFNDVAKDYTQNIVRCLENDDMPGIKAYGDALNEYCTKLSDAELDSLRNCVFKYFEEFKVDSIFAAHESNLFSNMEVDGRAPVREGYTDGEALPDTMRL